MLPHQLSCPIGGLLLSVLMLKDANPDHYPVPGVECVVSHESRQFTDDGHKVLLGHLGHPLRVGNTLVSAHCNVHSFSPPPKLDFSHLGAPHSTSANGSINALRDFLRVSVRTPTRKKSLRPSKSAPAYSFSPNEEVEHRRAQRAPPARWS